MTIYIVSGLPRSGTSMMMLMLKEGGMEIVYDDTLVPDETNPNGFFELRNIRNNFSKVKDGQGVKVLCTVLDEVPDGNYKIIYMWRNIDEVIMSRRKMHRLKGNPDAEEAEGWFKYRYKTSTEKAMKLLQERNIQYFMVDYNRLMLDDTIIDEVVQFLELPLDSHAMKQVIDKNLYRNRL